MRPRTIAELMAKRTAVRPADDDPAPALRVVCPWWMDPAGLSGKRAPGDREVAGRFPERVPPDP
jgi:hypothetical protein